MIGYISWTFSGFMSGSITGANMQPPAWLLIAMTVGGLIGNIVTTPILAISETLLYFDLRVRKQGYTFENLAGELGLPGTAAESEVSPQQ